MLECQAEFKYIEKVFCFFFFAIIFREITIIKNIHCALCFPQLDNPDEQAAQIRRELDGRLQMADQIARVKDATGLDELPVVNRWKAKGLLPLNIW